MKLLFIRHAESTGNAAQRMQGHADCELSLTGEQQAHQLAQRLQAEGWQPTHIYSSPLQRAAQTTAILTKIVLGEESALPVCYVAQLQEFQNGIFQGLTWMEAQQQYPALCQALEASRDWIPIPGAESLSDGRKRADQFIQQLMQKHQDQDTIWIITHHWILQHLIAALLGCSHTWKFSAGYTGLFEFWIDHTRWFQSGQNCFNSELWQIRRFNDCSHLG